jgi:hypothetical protein
MSVPLLARKLRKTVLSTLHHPAVLAHSTCQALSFDAALRVEKLASEATKTKEDLDHTYRMLSGTQRQFSQAQVAFAPAMSSSTSALTDTKGLRV